VAPASTCSQGRPAPVAIAPAGYGAERPTLATIGCGYEGSPEAREALGWAESLALRAQSRPRLVGVHEWLPPVSAPVGAGPTASLAQVLRRRQPGGVDEALGRLEPGLDASAELHDGSPAGVLEELSGELDLLVLGSRGYGPVRAVLLGSVSSALARGAECPLVVLPRGWSPQGG
jgi:nucleotide-binding universal stress UspA family protein